MAPESSGDADRKPARGERGAICRNVTRTELLNVRRAHVRPELILVVHPAGIEPASAVPETAVLSVELWVQTSDSIYDLAEGAVQRIIKGVRPGEHKLKPGVSCSFSLEPSRPR
jgi:hypothetical protein